MNVKEQSLYNKNSEIKRKIEKNIEYSNGRTQGFILLGATLGLAIFSLLNIASASFYTSMTRFHTEYFFVKRQFIFLVLGLFILFLGLATPYTFYRKKVFLKWASIISFLMFTTIVVGTVFHINGLTPLVNGSRRWINFGITRIQPSELLKIVYIFILAHMLSFAQNHNYKPLNTLKLAGISICYFPLFVLFERDMGTSIHYILIGAIMLFFTKIELKYFYRLFGIGIAFIVFIFSVYYYVVPDTNYRARRIRAYVNGVIHDDYDNGDGYQIKQSLIAIGSGGITGHGLGNGRQKYSYLPEIHTDFILASIGEEWGFVGTSLMFLVYFLILQIGLSIARTCRDSHGRFIAAGITGYLLTQIVMNVYVVTGLMPVTGIPLPLMSYGGTALWTTLFAIGVLYNINKNSLKRFEEDAD